MFSTGSRQTVPRHFLLNPETVGTRGLIEVECLPKEISYTPLPVVSEVQDRICGPTSPQTMASQLPLYLATFLTGLLECIGFAGVLFGWTSLLFVFKAENYFLKPCEQDCVLGGNATGLPGKDKAAFLKEAMPGSWELRKNREVSHAYPASLSMGEGRTVCPLPLCVEAIKEGSTYQLLKDTNTF